MWNILVLEVLAAEKLYANRKECTFAQPQVEYLRHLVLATEVVADPEKIEVMVNWPTPKI